MNDYRITLRCRLDDERQRRVAEFLQSFDDRRFKSRNQVILDALNAYIDAQNEKSHDDLLLDRIRQMFREEVQTIPAVPAVTASAISTLKEMTEEQKAKNAAGVLGFLETFG